MEKIRVLIADDHAIVRAGVRLLLESQSDMEVVGEAVDGHAAVEMVRDLEPDLILMDVAMPNMNGIEATQLIKERFPGVQVLALTMHEDERYFFRILQAGASGYVVKGASPADLLAAVRAVAQGQAYLYPSVAKQLLDDYLKRVEAGEERDSYDGLSEREREVLRLIAEGRTSRSMADQLVLSVNTVERHRANIMGKLNLHSRAELIKYAIRKGLISVNG
ncbi:MAG: response regulator transcription factor [Dehalococcoidia bacterium]|nr:response regulator transcription factor [Dehalococcoidia bacterium]